MKIENFEKASEIVKDIQYLQERLRLLENVQSKSVSISQFNDHSSHIIKAWGIRNPDEDTPWFSALAGVFIDKVEEAIKIKIADLTSQLELL